jgi:hypothetical protein
MSHSNCNCCECVWKRIVQYSNENPSLLTKRNLQLSYKIHNERIIWLGEEPTMNNLYPQTKSNICDCLHLRINNANPSSYPGTATSYKWALLNNENIWVE